MYDPIHGFAGDSSNINNAVCSTYKLIENPNFSHHSGYCCKCRSDLYSTYIEDGLYAVRCNHCKTLTLVKAPDPYTAETTVGTKQLIHESGYRVR